MTNELRVETTELRDLANRQTHAAAEFGDAGATTEGAGASVFSSHGVIAAGTAMAVNAANAARSTASSNLQTVSSGLAEKLGTAASQYDQTDSAAQSNLDSQMHPGG